MKTALIVGGVGLAGVALLGYFAVRAQAGAVKAAAGALSAHPELVKAGVGLINPAAGVALAAL